MKDWRFPWEGLKEMTNAELIDEFLKVEDLVEYDDYAEDTRERREEVKKELHKRNLNYEQFFVAWFWWGMLSEAATYEWKFRHQGMDEWAKKAKEDMDKYEENAERAIKRWKEDNK